MVTTRKEIDLIVVIGECHLEVEADLYKTMDRITDRIIEGDHKTVIEITSGEEIIERCKNYRGQNYRSGCRDNYRDKH